MTPDQVEELIEDTGVKILIQPSSIRAFSDSEYEKAGAIITEDYATAPNIFAIKEIPIEKIYFNKVYFYFAHVIKGQQFNMPMLQKLLDQKCTLIDYERIVNDYDQRLIFFGNYAGYAGMIDTFWAIGQRYIELGLQSPFSKVKKAHQYKNLEDAKLHLREIGHKIRYEGFSYQKKPLIFAFMGNGNVSHGAQEILECLPVKEVKVKEFISWFSGSDMHFHTTYKIIFNIKDLVKPRNLNENFNREEYLSHPEKYLANFEQYLPYITILISGIYWEEKYPRFVTKKWLFQAYKDNKVPLLTVIGDITADVNGSIEATIQGTDINSPVYIYDPIHDKAIIGVKGHGPVVMAIDNLPAELPKEASRYFGNILKTYIPILCKTNFDTGFDTLNLPKELKRGIIVYKGELTPDYIYLNKYLQ